MLAKGLSQLKASSFVPAEAAADIAYTFHNILT